MGGSYEAICIHCGHRLYCVPLRLLRGSARGAGGTSGPSRPARTQGPQGEKGEQGTPGNAGPQARTLTCLENERVLNAYVVKGAGTVMHTSEQSVDFDTRRQGGPGLALIFCIPK